MRTIYAVALIQLALLAGCTKNVTPGGTVIPDRPQISAGEQPQTIHPIPSGRRTLTQPVPENVPYVIAEHTVPSANEIAPIVVTPVPTPEELSVPLPKIPDRALALMPDLIQAIDDVWPDMPMRSYFPAQIEKESCITLTHSKCWNPRAELKTSREYGFGLGQLTIAYRADGSERFNAWAEIKEKHPDLRNWQWANRYDPMLQIKAIVVKNRVNWGAMRWEIADLDNRMAFLSAYYNGGSPARDRTICVNTAGCDPSRWWGNVELHSVKSRTKLREYGNRSLFEISRDYPKSLLRERRPKYIPYVGS